MAQHSCRPPKKRVINWTWLQLSISDWLIIQTITQSVLVCCSFHHPQQTRCAKLLSFGLTYPITVWLWPQHTLQPGFFFFFQYFDIKILDFFSKTLAKLVKFTLIENFQKFKFYCQKSNKICLKKIHWLQPVMYSHFGSKFWRFEKNKAPIISAPSWSHFSLLIAICSFFVLWSIGIESKNNRLILSKNLL
jgi:hypothetical protein